MRRDLGRIVITAFVCALAWGIAGPCALGAQTAATPASASQDDVPPRVTDVTRDIGPRQGGIVVTITGSGLDGATVQIDGKRAFVVSTSSQKLVIVTPPGRRGRRDLVIHTPGGGRVTSSYTYL